MEANTTDRPAQQEPKTDDPVKQFLRDGFEFLSSTKLACILMLLLFLLTLIGTFEQANMGLYEVQKKYFESFFCVVKLGPVPLGLPGGYLVMIVFTINLLLGGVLRVTKSKQKVGVIIIHLGVAFLMAAGYLKLHYSQEGHLTLYEGEQADEFIAHHESELVIADASQTSDVKEYVVPEELYSAFTGSGQVKFNHPDLPFELAISYYQPACQPRPATDPSVALTPAVEGITLVGLPKEQRDVSAPGVIVTATPKDGGGPTSAILWVGAQYPWLLKAGGKTWSIGLGFRRFKMPFAIHLDKFIHENHPGTRMAKLFRSEVTKVEQGVSQPIKISMNQPLRHRGYTLFQSSWGPQGAGPNARLFSRFSVVKNPSDHWPLYACIVISIGLVISYGQKLVQYVRAQSALRSAQ